MHECHLELGTCVISLCVQQACDLFWLLELFFTLSLWVSLNITKMFILWSDLVWWLWMTLHNFPVIFSFLENVNKFFHCSLLTKPWYLVIVIHNYTLFFNMKFLLPGARGEFRWPWQNPRICLEAFKSYCSSCVTEIDKCNKIYAATTTNSK